MEEILFKESEYSTDKTSLIGNKCTNCNKKFFPQRNFCPNCLKDESLKTFTLENSGTLYSYTRIHVAPKSFKTPYYIGHVDLADGIRLFGHINSENPEDVETGRKMNISLDEIGEKAESKLIGVVFTPSKEEK